MEDIEGLEEEEEEDQMIMLCSISAIIQHSNLLSHRFTVIIPLLSISRKGSCVQINLPHDKLQTSVYITR